jgi:hypothetical protein
MTEYITGGLESSFPEILAGMFADYQTRVPDWRPNPGAPEVVLMEVFALRHSVRLDTDSQVLASIFTYFGTSVANVPFGEATQATVTAVVTIGEEFVGEPHEIPAGLRVNIQGAEPEDTQVFEVVNTVHVEAGKSTAVVGLIAQAGGSQGSGLAGPAVLLDPRAWIQTITLDSDTAGGTEAEDETTYRNRLVAKERRDSPTIITALDAQEAILEIPGVGRCLILDNYVPKVGEEAPREGVPGAFTAGVSDPAGEDVSSETKEQALALVNFERLLDLTGYVIDPTRTGVTVEYEFTVFPGWEDEAVKAAADAAVAQYLSDAVWGLLPGAGGADDWQDELTVRYSKIYGVLNGVQGLNDVLSVKINGLLNTDATLAGPGALPTITSITGVLA